MAGNGSEKFESFESGLFLAVIAAFFAISVWFFACRSRKLDGTANSPQDTHQNGKSNFSSEAKLQWAGSRENISPPAVGEVFS